MNTRRSFFKQLAMSVAAISAPTIFIPKLIKPCWSSVVFAEPSLEDIIYRHRFESLQFNYLPSFRDFFTADWKPNLGEPARATN